MKDKPADAPATMFSEMIRVVELGAQIKKVMLKKGITKCRVRCDECKPARYYIWATLNGRKNHLHMRCENSAECGTLMME